VVVDDVVILGAFVSLRSRDCVVRTMAGDADTMEADAYVDEYVEFVAGVGNISYKQAEQVCVKLWRYYRAAIG